MRKIVIDTFDDLLKQPRLLIHLKKYKEHKDWINRKINEKAKGFYLYENNTIIGFLYLKIELPNEYENIRQLRYYGKKVIKIGSFLTNITYRRVGSVFMTIIELLAKKHDIHLIYGTTFSSNKNMIAFLEKYGYEYLDSTTGISGVENVYVKKLK